MASLPDFLQHNLPLSFLLEGGPGFVQKSIIEYERSKIRLMKPFRKCHKSGFSIPFMHFSSEVLLLLSQSQLACEGVLWAYDRFLHESWSYLFLLGLQSATVVLSPPSRVTTHFSRDLTYTLLTCATMTLTLSSPPPANAAWTRAWAVFDG